VVKRFKSGSVEEYIQYLRDLEDARGPFRNMMMALKEEFGEHQLRIGHHPHVAKLRCEIVQVFTDYLASETDVDSVVAITRGMANSGFWSYWKRKVIDTTTPREDVKEAMLCFFVFLSDAKGIDNHKAIAGLTW
jgi:hypothetical protein